MLYRLPGLDKPYLTVSVAFEWPHQLNFLRFICFDFFSRKLAEEWKIWYKRNLSLDNNEVYEDRSVFTAVEFSFQMYERHKCMSFLVANEFDKLI